MLFSKTKHDFPYLDLIFEKHKAPVSLGEHVFPAGWNERFRWTEGSKDVTPL